MTSLVPVAIVKSGERIVAAPDATLVLSRERWLVSEGQLMVVTTISGLMAQCVEGSLITGLTTF
jgi:hypothetical protein